MTKILANSHIKENNGVTMRADIYYSDDGVHTVHYSINDELSTTETYPQKPLHFVEGAVSRWFDNVQMLKG